MPVNSWTHRCNVGTHYPGYPTICLIHHPNWHGSLQNITILRDHDNHGTEWRAGRVSGLLQYRHYTSSDPPFIIKLQKFPQKGLLLYKCLFIILSIIPDIQSYDRDRDTFAVPKLMSRDSKTILDDWPMFLLVGDHCGISFGWCAGTTLDFFVWQRL